MSGTAFRRRIRAFTFPQLVMAVAVVGLLMMMSVQAMRYATKKADMQRLLNKGNHLSTCLELYHQRNNRYPDAYPAHLEEDLAPYTDDEELFVSPAAPDAGAEPLNRSYVTPVLGQQNTYVLSLNSESDPEHAAVVYADMSARVVKRLPITHDGEEIEPGTVVGGGTVTFGNASTVELSEAVTATVVQSFVGDDDNSFSVVKVNRDIPGMMTAVAVGAGVVEVASDAGVTLVRGGVADVEFMQEDGENYAKVATRSGEVIVNGKVVRNGELVGNVVETNPDNTMLFTVDEDNYLVAQEDCTAHIRILGKAITYGAGGPDCAVQAGAKIGDDAAWEWLFNGSQVYGGEEYTQDITKGTRIAAMGRASYDWWSRTYKSTVDRRQCLVLVNGDEPPEFDPFDNQPEITEFCGSVMDPSTGRITIEPHQALILFELGTTNMSSSAADFQDLVMLVDFARIGNLGATGSGDALSGKININPNNTDNFKFLLTKPDGTNIVRDDLLDSRGSLTYDGPALGVRVQPKGNGNQNSLMLNGDVYPLQNGRVYRITALKPDGAEELTPLDVHLYNDHDNSGAAMGRWWIEITAPNAKIEKEPAPDVGNHKVTIGDNNKITVHDDVSLGVRVLGTDLREWYLQRRGSNSRWLQRDIPISLRIKINHDWHEIKNGKAVQGGYQSIQELETGTELAVKAISYDGYDSASYHSADGSGHVLTVLPGQVPDRIAPDAENTPNLEDYARRALDQTTRTATIAPNQLLMLFELEEEYVDSPDATFQDIGVLLTFTPASLHKTNRKNDGTFDGYGSSDSTDPVGPTAETYATENGMDLTTEWAMTREADLPIDDGSSDSTDSTTDDSSTEDPIDDGSEPDYTDDDSTADYTEADGVSRRILGRGVPVKEGWWVKVTGFNR
ncbi:MAG: pilus assembly FimT family protein [Planctomycetota bacterium]